MNTEGGDPSKKLKPERDVEIPEIPEQLGLLVFKQHFEGELRELIFNPALCNGCKFCVYACPVKAIEFAGFEALAAGMPLIIDHLSCAYCGICYAFCPFNAFEFRINGEIVEKSKLPLSLGGKIEKLENCVDCMLCVEVCPVDAIERRVLARREDFPKADARGSIRIDTEKCNLCGICASFCDAFKLVDKDVKPGNLTPFAEILIDEEKCDYCGLCVKLCPEEAIEVESSKVIEADVERVAEVVFTDRCIHCGYCVAVCPYEAVINIKPVEGEIKVYWKRLARVCEPLSCKACVVVCKTRAWHIDSELKLEPEFCVYCGACENVCPHRLIEVDVHAIHLAESIKWPAWWNAVSRILSKQTVEREIAFSAPAPVSKVPEALEAEIGVREKAGIKAKLIRRNLAPLREALKKPGYRKAFERGNMKTFLGAVKRYARKT
ncbi:4Fe-4S binding protein [Archaeoglobus veneficus]|uniref:4Fe-4S ferredoxin iron-sulfur binding domain-containing protein n=1 Tax=Archaeoglobus veneficus (strain DSM 11195 / SNP6) TaxID=693661 RepID=F2KT57_ARCVS|nr:4Fe-4S binding protein [Archaeoglobus veneficus]AEA47087.1 4Fe-4S ferredoxin iron-sulfur binding domain-containing protein [Archaeoglobus veneficus SNP6]